MENENKTNGNGGNTISPPMMGMALKLVWKAMQFQGKVSKRQHNKFKTNALEASQLFQETKDFVNRYLASSNLKGSEKQ